MSTIIKKPTIKDVANLFTGSNKQQAATASAATTGTAPAADAASVSASSSATAPAANTATTSAVNSTASASTGTTSAAQGATQATTGNAATDSSKLFDSKGDGSKAKDFFNKDKQDQTADASTNSTDGVTADTSASTTVDSSNASSSATATDTTVSDSSATPAAGATADTTAANESVASENVTASTGGTEATDMAAGSSATGETPAETNKFQQAATTAKADQAKAQAGVNAAQTKVSSASNMASSVASGNFSGVASGAAAMGVPGAAQAQAGLAKAQAGYSKAQGAVGQAKNFASNPLGSAQSALSSHMPSQASAALAKAQGLKSSAQNLSLSSLTSQASNLKNLASQASSLSNLPGQVTATATQAATGGINKAAAIGGSVAAVAGVAAIGATAAGVTVAAKKYTSSSSSSPTNVVTGKSNIEMKPVSKTTSTSQQSSQTQAKPSKSSKKYDYFVNLDISSWPNGGKNDDELIPTNVTVTENLSKTATCSVEFRSQTDPSKIKASDILNKSALIVLAPKIKDQERQAKRYFNGIVVSLVVTGHTEDKKDGKPIYYNYKTEIVPHLAILTRRKNSQIFQDKTAKEMLTSILKDAGFDTKEYDVNGIQNTTKYPYFVQYNETDFDFIKRICIRAGIGYVLQHSETNTTIVFIDNKNGYKGQAKNLSLTADDDGCQLLEPLAINNLLTAARKEIKGYDFTNPTKTSCASATTSTLNNNDKLTHYEYGSDSDFVATNDCRNAVKVFVDSEDAKSLTGSARSNYFDLQTGALVTFEKDKRNWVITSLEFSASAENYTNSFTCGVADYVYLPDAAMVPVIPGILQGVAVGPEGHEGVYADEYGRIKVQFYWDRNGKNNDSSSCWIPVQTNWGELNLPPVGVPVVVSFIGGNPNQPLVIGTIYDGAKKPPVNPKEKKDVVVLAGGNDAKQNRITSDNSDQQQKLTIATAKDGEIVVPQGGKLTINVGQDNSTIEVDDKGNITIGNKQKAKITLAPDGLKLSFGGSSEIEIGAQGVAIKGPMVKVN